MTRRYAQPKTAAARSSSSPSESNPPVKAKAKKTGIAKTQATGRQAVEQVKKHVKHLAGQDLLPTVQPSQRFSQIKNATTNGTSPSNTLSRKTGPSTADSDVPAVKPMPNPQNRIIKHWEKWHFLNVNAGKEVPGHKKPVSEHPRLSRSASSKVIEAYDAMMEQAGERCTLLCDDSLSSKLSKLVGSVRASVNKGFFPSRRDMDELMPILRFIADETHNQSKKRKPDLITLANTLENVFSLDGEKDVSSQEVRVARRALKEANIAKSDRHLIREHVERLRNDALDRGLLGIEPEEEDELIHRVNQTPYPYSSVAEMAVKWLFNQFSPGSERRKEQGFMQMLRYEIFGSDESLFYRWLSTLSERALKGVADKLLN